MVGAGDRLALIEFQRFVLVGLIEEGGELLAATCGVDN